LAIEQLSFLLKDGVACNSLLNKSAEAGKL